MKLTLFYIMVILFAACQVDKTDNQAEIEYYEIKENTIINIYDAFGKDKAGLIKDFGFASILKFKGKIILFDSGSNATTFKQNVTSLGIDLSKVDIAIASHSHFDHISGFDYLLEVNPDVKIYFPYDIYWGANFSFNLSGTKPSISDSLPKEMQYFNGEFQGYTFNQSGRFWNANIEYVKASQEIFPGISLIATASPNMGYFSKHPLSTCHENEVGCDEHWDKAKFIKLPELTLSLNTTDGDVVIVGCSHSLVETIIEENKSFTNNNIALVYGGYHLLPYSENDIIELANKMKTDLGVNKVAPTHCTGHLAFKIFKDLYQNNYIFAGLGEEVTF